MPSETSTSGRGEERVYIGLGANLGDRQEAILTALRRLGQIDGIRLFRVSRFYETEPVGGPPLPKYLNAVAALECRLEPADLMDRLLQIERELGRVRRAKNEPRTIDVDLLLFGDRIIEEPNLSVPHPRMHERDFVLRPLCDIAPEAWHPGLNASAAQLRAELLKRWPETK